MERAAECSGSVAMETQVRKTGRYFELPDRARTSGIRIHEWNAAEALGADTNKLELDSDERATAKHCVELRDISIAAWESNYQSNGSAEIIVEKRFWYRRGLEPLFSAQIDYTKIDHANRRALILDYKTGRKECEQASDNLQLRSEAVLLKHCYPKLEEISAAIIEPWVSWDSIQVVYSGDSLRQAENQILQIVSNTVWEANKRVAGLWCRHCHAKAYCQEAINYAQTIRQMDPKQAIIELPRGEAGTRMWERLKVAKRLVESLEAAYTKIMESEPDALPGYVLPERGIPRRKVPFPAKLKDALVEYLTPEEIDGCADFRLGKLEELLGIKHGISDKKHLKTLFKSLTKDVLTIVYDVPFIRALTKKERELANK